MQHQIRCVSCYSQKNGDHCPDECPKMLGNVQEPPAKKIKKSRTPYIPEKTHHTVGLLWLNIG